MEDLTGVSFKDTVFLQQFGLSEMNALEYFSNSQFYDRSCINEQLKMQARFNELNVNLLDSKQMTGYEYYLDSFTYEPSLFVIKKLYRSSPVKSELAAVYYILQGTIYQAPSLSSLYANRILMACHHLNAALDIAQNGVIFSPIQGYSWKDQKPIQRSSGAKTIQEQQLQMEFTFEIDKFINDLN